MCTLRLSLAGTATLMLLGGLSGAVLAQSEGSDAGAFPTGTFVSLENPDHTHEFNEDGTGRAFVVNEWEVHINYGVHRDLWTEMTFEYPGSEADGSQTPATYYWDWDGEHLTFELWGEDLRPHRNFVLSQNIWVPVLDPRVVYVARNDQSPGKMVAAHQRIVPGAEAADAITDLSDLRGRTTAVAIHRGQPITPDMLSRSPSSPSRRLACLPRPARLPA